MTFPNNGFVDANGQLTKAGQNALLQFTKDYASPIAFLRSVQPKMAMLIEEHVNLGFYDIEDFNASVFMHAADAIRRYDPEKASVNTFLTWQIRKTARIYASKYKLRPIRALGLGEDQDLSLWDTCERAFRQDKIVDSEEEDAMYEILRILPKIQRNVLIDNIVHECTLTAISQRMEISRQRVKQIRNAALRKLRGLDPRELGRDHAKRSRMTLERYKKKPCKHCGKPSARPRQLCSKCYNNLDIRNIYPIDPQVAKWKSRQPFVAIDAH